MLAIYEVEQFSMGKKRNKYLNLPCLALLYSEGICSESTDAERRPHQTFPSLKSAKTGLSKRWVTFKVTI